MTSSAASTTWSAPASCAWTSSAIASSPPGGAESGPAWRATPGNCPEADRLVAAGELLRVEVEYRVRRGEVPIAREYEETDPALDPTWVEQVIAAEMVVHRSDLSAASPASGRPEAARERRT